MRKMQAELSFEDSSYKVSRAMEQLSNEVPDFTMQRPMPRRHKMRVVCLECDRAFSTTSSIPECPNCGGSDIDLA